MNLWSMAGFIFALNLKIAVWSYQEISQLRDSGLS